jgi:serine/threonine protein kinase
MELCTGGTLSSKLHERGYKLSEKLVARYIHQTLTAIFYLHEYGIAHRDIKPNNILLTDNTENAEIKLIDFGLSRILGPNETCKEPYGTLVYLAPEVLQESNYSKQVDIWSVGVMTYLLLLGKLPFFSKITKDLINDIIYKEVDFSNEDCSNLSKSSIDFISCK